MKPILRRTQSYFDKRSGEFIGEDDLVGITLPELQTLFGVDQDDPMYESYIVTEKHAHVLRSHVDGVIDLDRYDYLLDCHCLNLGEYHAYLRSLELNEEESAKPKNWYPAP